MTSASKATSDTLGECNVDIHVADSELLMDRVRPGSLGAVVANPPYGLRLGRKWDFV